MHKSFELSVLDKFVLFIAVLANGSVAALRNDWSPEGAGYFLGSITMPLFIPLLLALLVWRLSGRRQAAGSATLLAFSGLMILSAFAQFSQTLVRGSAENELLNARETFRNNLAEGPPEDAGSAYNQFADTVGNSFDTLARNSRGDAARVYSVMADFSRESAAQASRWRELADAAMAPEILDLDLLVRSKDYQGQLDTLTAYIEATRSYKETVLGMYGELTERLRPIGLESEEVKGVLKGYRERFAEQRPVLIPLMDAHVTYGESLSEAIKFLRRIDTHWDREDGVTLLDTDDHVNEYNRLIDAVVQSENELNALDAQFVALQ